MENEAKIKYEHRDCLSKHNDPYHLLDVYMASMEAEKAVTVYFVSSR